MDSGKKRAVTVWHRRSGKDKMWFNYLVKRAYQTKGVYFYFFPTFTQGKKVLWFGMDKEGFRTLDHVPQEIRDGKPNDTEMRVRLDNGSIIQVIGTDNIDNIVGTNPVGCVFSEYSLQDPQAWDYIRPILAENGGWAAFNFTPRGKMNHGFDLYQLALSDPEHWFCERLTVEDTHAISQEALEQERKELFQKYGDDAFYMQEYHCSFESAIQGAYYVNNMELATREGRITRVPYERTLPVDTWWDLGVGDATGIWFSQTVGREIRFIDYFQASGEGFPFYAKVLQDRGYIYGTHHAPHDIEVRELGSGKSRVETAALLGLKFITVPNISIDDGINAVRVIFDRCWFDAEKCKQGLNALSNYHKEYDEKRKEYKNTPYHDWSSHAADAFRYFAVGFKDKKEIKKTSLSLPVYGQQFKLS